MENPATLIDGFVHHIDDCQTSYDVFRLFKQVANAFSFSHFVVFDIPHENINKHPSTHEMCKIRDVSYICNWPPELLSAYDEYGLFVSSPMLEHVTKDARPLVFDVVEISQSRIAYDAEVAVDLFTRFGLTSGVCFSAHQPSGRRGVMCLIGENVQVDTAHLAALQYFFNLVYNKINELERGTELEVPIKVPPREIDCLDWTARGKTSFEISVILGLSENTVTGYLASAAKRLKAQNRAHAVAVAIRMGIIG